MKNGYVYLVGAGPGDLRLITVKGKQCLEEADVVLYDRLVNPLLLEWTKPDAELVYCGKLPDRHVLRQEAINDLLVQYAREGKNVVRLKGGDPSVYGRVGEEATALEEEEIDYEIIPGITSGIAAATYAGVPVTHREHGASFAVLTGHDKSPSGQPLVDWKAVATGIDTIAFYMGVKNLPYICEQLIRHGRDKQTPVMLIQWGTLGKQKTLTGTLETIAELVQIHKFSNPSITLVGDVVKLRTKESWFERQLLFGKHILYARTEEGKSEIAESLVELGANVFQYPRIQTRSFEASFNPEMYDRIVFLSPRSVNWFFRKLKKDRIDIRKVQAKFYGGSVKSIREIESFSCFAQPVQDMINEGKCLVIGSKKWQERLEKRTQLYGEHDFIASHEDQIIEQSNVTCQRILDEDRVNTIVFPSRESVAVMTEQIKQVGETPSSLSTKADVICFGESSYKAAIEYGYTVSEVLKEPTKQALLDTLVPGK